MVARESLYCASRISYTTFTLPTIRVHSELDWRTLDMVHHFYHEARHFSPWKIAFSVVINLPIPSRTVAY